MTSWRLLYENRFPANATTGKTVFGAHRAAAGAQTEQSPPAFFDADSLAGFGIGDGRNLTYRPDAPLRQLIGVDIAMEIAIVSFRRDRPFTVFSTDGSDLSATLTGTVPAAGQTVWRLTLQVSDVVTTIDGLRFPSGSQPLGRRRLQLRWTTNGQLHVLFEGQLVAYENAVKPGHRFDVGRLSIGDVDQPDNGEVNAKITKFRLVELREDSTIGAFGDQLNPEYVPTIPDRCERAARARLQQLLLETRKLMAGFTASQTSPWRESDSGTPFTPVALAAHKAGAEAGLAFARYLRDGATDTRAEVSSRMRELLAILAADQPTLFKKLIAQADAAREALYTDCRGVAEDVRHANPRLFKKLDPLAAELEALIRRLGAEN